MGEEAQDLRFAITRGDIVLGRASKATDAAMAGPMCAPRAIAHPTKAGVARVGWTIEHARATTACARDRAEIALRSC